MVSASMAPEDLEILERRGVDTLVDLRVAGEGDALRERAVQVGLRYVSLPVATELPTDAQVDRVLAELALERKGLLLLVCGTGSRSAIFFAIHSKFSSPCRDSRSVSFMTSA